MASVEVFQRKWSQEVVYGVSLTENDVRVVINIIFDGSDPLPIPVAGNIETINDAIGFHVQWPKNLLVLYRE